MSLLCTTTAASARRHRVTRQAGTSSLLQFRQNAVSTRQQKDTFAFCHALSSRGGARCGYNSRISTPRPHDGSKRWNSFVPPSRALASLDPSSSNKNEAWEVLGVSLLAVSASALLMALYPSKGYSAGLDTRNGTTSSSREVSGTTAAATTTCESGSGSLVATSAIFMDPAASVGSALDVGAAAFEQTKKDAQAALKANAPILSPKGNATERTYDLSVRAIKGNRLNMEDTFFVAPGGRFVAVFDGHGGASVSSYLRDNLYPMAEQALRRKRWELDAATDDDESGAVSRNAASISSRVAALRTAFAQAEEQIVNDDARFERQGSTAVAVWVHEDETPNGNGSSSPTRTLVSANVGDSRAILSRQGKAVDLTRDHKPNEEREKQRIKKAGGTLEWDALAKVHRVSGLSLSRAIGDSFAKPIISSEVDIRLFPVIEDQDEFLLLASDGLWDVMSSQQVVSYVKERFEEELSRKELHGEEDVANCKTVLRRHMARSLCKEAMRRGTGDNVCVLIVWLNNDSGKFGTTSSSSSTGSVSLGDAAAARAESRADN